MNRFSSAERLPHLDQRYGANLEPEKILAVVIAAQLADLVTHAAATGDTIDWCTLDIQVRNEPAGDQHMPVLRTHVRATDTQ